MWRVTGRSIMHMENIFFLTYSCEPLVRHFFFFVVVYYPVLGVEFWTICLFCFECSHRMIYIAPLSSPLEWAGPVPLSDSHSPHKAWQCCEPFLDCLNGFYFICSETRVPNLCCILKYGSNFLTKDGHGILGPHVGSSQLVQTRQPAMDLFHNELNMMAPA